MTSEAGPTPGLGLSELAGLAGGLSDLADDLDLVDPAVSELRDVDFDLRLEVLEHATKLLGRMRAIVGGIHDVAWEGRGEVYGDYHHPTLGVVSVRRTANRTRWDHEGTARRVVDAHMADTPGEVPPPDEVLGWFLEAGAVSYWRKTVLKSYGIDAAGEDLVWSEKGSPSITFPSR